MSNFLPSVLKSYGVSYNELENMIVSSAYTSQRHNTYFKGTRLSEKIFIETDIGIGYCHEFLNRISVWQNNKGKLELIGSRYFHKLYYSASTVKDFATHILKEKLERDCIANKEIIDSNSLTDFATEIVEGAFGNQLDNIRKIQNGKLLRLN